MKIAIVSYEYDPFPGGGIATYHNAAVRILAEAGHEVHVVTNSALHGREEEHYKQAVHEAPIDGPGSLTIHRLHYFDSSREVPRNAQFLDVCPDRYAGRAHLYGACPSNIAASQAAAYVEHLHRQQGLDVVECPEFFAEAFYMLRARRSGRSASFPPICIHGHISSRFAFSANLHAWEVGYYPHRQKMLREEYCVQEADALLTPSHALMRRYEDLFGAALPKIRRTISYYLELPPAAEKPPEPLRGLNYMVCVGRIEPRKGSDLAMEAFARLAPKFDDLHLVFLGKEMWHHGEAVDDVIDAHVPREYRDRVVRLGNVPRDEALAAGKFASVFLHPAPWDNYPCAVLEAMGVGAACVVSDQGGHSEMVKDGVSGLHFPVGDAEALARCAERMLTDTEFAKTAREAAVRRAQAITEPNALTQQKLELVDAMLEQEKTMVDVQAVQTRTKAIETVDRLPGGGVVLVDAGGFDKWTLGSTLSSLERELESSPNYELVVLVDADHSKVAELEIPENLRRVTTIDEPVWQACGDDDYFVYMHAGVRFDLGRLRDVVCQLRDARVNCGSVAWLRPPDAAQFPYPPDFGWQDQCVVDTVIPPVFAVKASALASVTSLSGMFKANARLSILMALASAENGIRFQHTGDVLGDTYRDLPRMDHDTQWRTLGVLDMRGHLPREWTMVGSLPELPMAEVATQPGQAQPAQAASSNGSSQVREKARVEVREPADYEQLQQIYREHMALKNHRAVKALRKLGVFGAVRKMLPGSKKLLGDG
ncbi:MAG: glycosyltransferase family 4 protein [Planctomycetota bacterium]